MDLKVYIRVMDQGEVELESLYGEETPTPLLDMTNDISRVKDLIRNGRKVYVYADTYARDGVLVSTQNEVDNLFRIGGQDYIASHNGNPLPSHVLPAINKVDLQSINNILTCHVDWTKPGWNVHVTNSKVELIEMQKTGALVVETKDIAGTVTFATVKPGIYRAKVTIEYTDARGNVGSVVKTSRVDVTIAQNPKIILIEGHIANNVLHADATYEVGVGNRIASRQILAIDENGNVGATIDITDPIVDGVMHASETFTNIKPGKYTLKFVITYTQDGNAGTVRKESPTGAVYSVEEKPSLADISASVNANGDVNVTVGYSLGTGVIIDTSSVELISMDSLGTETVAAVLPLAKVLTFKHVKSGTYKVRAKIRFTDSSGSHNIDLETTKDVIVRRIPEITDMVLTRTATGTLEVTADFDLGSGYDIIYKRAQLVDSSTNAEIQTVTLAPKMTFTSSVGAGSYYVRGTIRYQYKNVLQPDVVFATNNPIKIITPPSIGTVSVNRTGNNAIDVTVVFDRGTDADISVDSDVIELVDATTRRVISHVKLTDTTTFDHIPEGTYFVRARLEYDNYGTKKKIVSVSNGNFDVKDLPVINSIVPNLNGTGDIAVSTSIDYNGITLGSDDKIELIFADGPDTGKVAATSLMAETVIFPAANLIKGTKYKVRGIITYTDYKGLAQTIELTSNPSDDVYIIDPPVVTHLSVSSTKVDEAVGVAIVQVAINMGSVSLPQGGTPTVQLFREGANGANDKLVASKPFTGTNVVFDSLKEVGRYYAVVIVPYDVVEHGVSSISTITSKPSYDSSYDGESVKVFKEPVVKAISCSEKNGHVVALVDVVKGDGVDIQSATIKLYDKLTDTLMETINSIPDTPVIFGHTITTNPPQTYYVKASIIYDGYALSSVTEIISSDITVTTSGTVLDTNYGNSTANISIPMYPSNNGGSSSLVPGNSPEGGLLWTTTPQFPIPTVSLSGNIATVTVDPSVRTDYDTVSVSLKDHTDNIVSTVAIKPSSDVNKLITFELIESGNYKVIITGTYTDSSNNGGLDVIPTESAVFPYTGAFTEPVIDTLRADVLGDLTLSINLNVIDTANVVDTVSVELRNATDNVIETIDMTGKNISKFTTVLRDHSIYVVEVIVQGKGFTDVVRRVVKHINKAALANAGVSVVFGTPSYVDHTVTVQFGIHDPNKLFQSGTIELVDAGGASLTPKVEKSVDVTDSVATLTAPADGDYRFKLSVVDTKGRNIDAMSVVVPNVHVFVAPTFTFGANITSEELVVHIPYSVDDTDNTWVSGSLELVSESGASLVPPVVTTLSRAGILAQLSALDFGKYKAKATIHDTISGSPNTVISNVFELKEYVQPMITSTTDTSVEAIPTITNTELTIEVPEFMIYDPDNTFLSGVATLIRNGATTSIANILQAGTNTAFTMVAPSDGDYSVEFEIFSTKGNFIRTSNILSDVHSHKAPTISGFSITNDELTINVPAIHIDDPDGTFVEAKAELLDPVNKTGLEKVLTFDASGDSAPFTFDAPTDGSDYRVKVTVSNSTGTASEMESNILVNVHTKVSPTVDSFVITNDGLIIEIPEITINDPDSTFTSAKLTLYKDGTATKETKDLSVGTNGEFTLVADGHGAYKTVVEVIHTVDPTTPVTFESNEIPDVHSSQELQFSLPTITNKGLEISFPKFTILDPQDVFISGKGELYHDGKPTGITADLAVGVNTGVKFNVTEEGAYFIRVTVKQRAGNDIVKDTNTLTDVKGDTKPTFTAPTITSNGFDITIPSFNIHDPSDVASSVTATLYKDGTATSEVTTLTLNNDAVEEKVITVSDAGEYKFKIIVTVTSGSPAEGFTNEITVASTTPPTVPTDPTISNDELDVTVSEFDIEDPDSTATGVKAVLQSVAADGTVTDTTIEQTLTPDSSGHVAESTLSATADGSYQVKIVIENTVGNDVVIITNRLTDVHANVAPSFTMPTPTSDDLTITVPEFTITDDDDTLTSVKAKLLSLDGSDLNPVVESDLTPNANKVVAEFTLTAPADGDYKVSIIIANSVGADVTDEADITGVHTKVEPTVPKPEVIDLDLEATVSEFDITDPDHTFTSGKAVLVAVAKDGTETVTTSTKALSAGTNAEFVLHAPSAGDYYVKLVVNHSANGGGVITVKSDTLNDMHGRVAPSVPTKPAIAKDELEITVGEFDILDDDGVFTSIKAVLESVAADGTETPLTPPVEKDLTPDTNKHVDEFTLTAPADGDYKVRLVIVHTIGTDVHVESEVISVAEKVKPSMPKPTLTADELEITIPEFTITDTDGTFTSAKAVLINGDDSDLTPEVKHDIASSGTVSTFTLTAPADGDYKVKFTIESSKGNVEVVTDAIHCHEKVKPSMAKPTLTVVERVITIPEFEITDTDSTFTSAKAVLINGDDSDVTPEIKKDIQSAGTVATFDFTAPADGDYKVKFTIVSSKGNVEVVTDAVTCHEKVKPSMPKPTLSADEKVITVPEFEITDADGTFTSAKAVLINGDDSDLTPEVKHDIASAGTVATFTLTAPADGDYKVKFMIANSKGTDVVVTTDAVTCHTKVDRPTITNNGMDLDISPFDVMATDIKEIKTAVQKLNPMTGKFETVTEEVVTPDANGLIAGKTVTVDKYGTYRVKVTLTPNTGNPISRFTNILDDVVDSDAPSFTVPTVENTGANFKIPSFDITDDASIVNGDIKAVLFKDGETTPVETVATHTGQYYVDNYIATIDKDTTHTGDGIKTLPYANFVNTSGDYKFKIIIPTSKGDIVKETAVSTMTFSVVPDFNSIPTVEVNTYETGVHIGTFNIARHENNQGYSATLYFEDENGVYRTDHRSKSSPDIDSEHVGNIDVYKFDGGRKKCKVVIEIMGGPSDMEPVAYGDIMKNGFPPIIVSNTQIVIDIDGEIENKAPEVTVPTLSSDGLDVQVSEFEITDANDMFTSAKAVLYSGTTTFPNPIEHTIDAIGTVSAFTLTSIPSIKTVSVLIEITGKDGRVSKTFTNSITLKEKPTVTKPTLIKTDLEIGLGEFEITDPDTTFTSGKAVLIHEDGTLVTPEVSHEITATGTIPTIDLVAPAAGTYKVRITVVNTAGSDVVIETDSVNATEPLRAPSITKPTVANTDLTVHVTGLTLTDPDSVATGATAELIKLDGSSLTPAVTHDIDITGAIHAFDMESPVAGPYKVKVTVENSLNMEVITISDKVTTTAPHVDAAPVIAKPTLTNTDLTVHVGEFTITDTDNTFTSGTAELVHTDGTPLTPAVTHTIDAAGTVATFDLVAPSVADYKVKVTVVNTTGTDVVKLSDTITTTAPHIDAAPTIAKPTLTNTDLTVHVAEFDIDDIDSTFTSGEAELVNADGTSLSTPVTHTIDAAGTVATFDMVSPSAGDYKVKVTVVNTTGTDSTAMSDTITTTDPHVDVAPTVTKPTVSADERTITVSDVSITDTDSTFTSAKAILINGDDSDLTPEVKHDISAIGDVADFTLTAPADGDYKVKVIVVNTTGTDATSVSDAVTCHTKVKPTIAKPSVSADERVITVDEFEITDADSTFTSAKAILINGDDSDLTPEVKHDISAAGTVATFTLTAPADGDYKVKVIVESTKGQATVSSDAVTCHTKRDIPEMSNNGLDVVASSFDISEPDISESKVTLQILDPVTGETTDVHEEVVTNNTNGFIDSKTFTVDKYGDYRLKITLTPTTGDPIIKYTDVLEGVVDSDAPTISDLPIEATNTTFKLDSFVISDPNNLINGDKVIGAFREGELEALLADKRNVKGVIARHTIICHEDSTYTGDGVKVKPYAMQLNDSGTFFLKVMLHTSKGIVTKRTATFTISEEIISFNGQKLVLNSKPSITANADKTGIHIEPLDLNKAADINKEIEIKLIGTKTPITIDDADGNGFRYIKGTYVDFSSDDYYKGEAVDLITVANGDESLYLVIRIIDQDHVLGPDYSSIVGEYANEINVEPPVRKYVYKISEKLIAPRIPHVATEPELKFGDAVGKVTLSHFSVADVDDYTVKVLIEEIDPISNRPISVISESEVNPDKNNDIAESNITLTRIGDIRARIVFVPTSGGPTISHPTNTLTLRVSDSVPKFTAPDVEFTDAIFKTDEFLITDTKFITGDITIALFKEGSDECELAMFNKDELRVILRFWSTAWNIQLIMCHVLVKLFPMNYVSCFRLITFH